MSYQVELSDRAGRDLENAYRRYAKQVPETAVRWYNGFLAALEGLANHPQRCPVAPQSRKLGVETRHLLYGRRRSYGAYFVVRQEMVLVLHIRHTARRQPRPEDLL